MCFFQCNAGDALSDLIRIRYNTMAHNTPNGEWKWRVVLEADDGFEEVLVKSVIVNVPSFTREDDMPVVGRKYHMACRGRLRVVDGVGIIDQVSGNPAGGEGV